MNLKSTALRKALKGFTLVELMSAVFIFTLVTAAASSAFIRALRIWNQERIISELNYDMEQSLERIRADLRLSSISIGHMAFYPGGASEYTALSFPMAVDDDNDGLLERSSDGKIIWDQTIIYYVRPTSPNQFMRIKYRNRNTNATPAQLYTQLSQVVLATNDTQIQAAAMSGEVGSSQILFRNLVQLRIRPPLLTYDGYAATPGRSETIPWGSMILTGGYHTLKFTVVGKATNSTGYKVGIDKFRLSSTASSRDAEMYYPRFSHPSSPFYDYTNNPTTMVVSNQDMSAYGSEWSGNCQLNVHAAASNDSITFQVWNDLWCDNNFDDPVAAIASNCTVKLDRSFASSASRIPDVVVSMDKGRAWIPGSVTYFEQSLPSGTKITNMIYGGTNIAAAITRNGCWARVQFEAGDTGLLITNVWFRNRGTGAARQMTFPTNQSWAVVARDAWSWTEWLPYWETDKNSDYCITYELLQGGDDDYDLFVGGAGGSSLYGVINRGPATTDNNWDWPVAPWMGLMAATAFVTPTFCDLDGDGDDDLFCGDQNGRISYFQNNGSCLEPVWGPMVYPWRGIVSGGYAAPTFADIDADGDKDLFIGSSYGTVWFYRNTGTVSQAQFAPPVTNWMNFSVSPYAYSAPAFADIDGDGDLDLFAGSYWWSGVAMGQVFFAQNTGSATNFQWSGTPVTNYAGIANPLTRLAFADINQDGDIDMFAGGLDGRIEYYKNIGDATNAVWDLRWPNYANVNVGSWSAPAIVNINRGISRQAVAAWAYPEGYVMSYTNGYANNLSLGISAIEVRYPSNAIYRSGIFDTLKADPDYHEMNWTMQEVSEGALLAGDVDVRIRSGDEPDLSDSSGWKPTTGDGYFQGGEDNAISAIDGGRYVQYEAHFTAAGSHTNTGILRDVTIDWTAARGIVDLYVDFGKGPDYGIVTATCDGNSFIKGLGFNLTIYKTSWRGQEQAAGAIEVCPLNTGR